MKIPVEQPSQETSGRDQRSISLARKASPAKRHSRGTFELVLSTAGELLAEVGFERLTTNLVCQRAGLTPPALYYYFPNKYALLAELGRRLMEAQDAAVFGWLTADQLADTSVQAAIEGNAAILTRVVEITRAFPGGVWIMRALRAVPILQQIRIESRNGVAARLEEVVRRRYSRAVSGALVTSTKVAIEFMYAATEMILEEPGVDEAVVIRDASEMISYHFERRWRD